jgi:hypothetical protein
MHLELTPSLCPLNIAPFHNYRKYRTSPVFSRPAAATLIPLAREARLQLTLPAPG